MSEATWHTGDSLTVLKTLPDASVDLIITSPPFLALRSYLPADHPDKQAEMGSEATPGAFVDGLMRVVEECRRVLAPHGSLCIELGDTYAGTYGEGYEHTKFAVDKGLGMGLSGTGPMRDKNGEAWPLAKSLSLIPETVRFTMAYGRNPHTGRTTDQWRIRNVVRWVRPNPPVGALGDKYRPATSEMLVACVSGKRYFDLDAVRTEPTSGGAGSVLGPTRATMGYRGSQSGGNNDIDQPHLVSHPAGAPPLDWWNIPTQPYKGSHYATWPKRLLDIPIRSMCPQRVCRVCGVPSTRITHHTGDSTDYGNRQVDGRLSGGPPPGLGPKIVPTGVWSDCGHDDWRNGIVLDPFAGSGTTLEVATGMGRDAIGIDLDERNFDLAEQRVGMFLTLSDQ